MNIPDGQYEFSKYEAEMLQSWLDKKLYKPEYNPETKTVESIDKMKKNSREAFSIICPPPNAYGRPHMGNLSGYAYQDAIGRYQRMKGKKVLLLPGKDHAGLEGEGVFVREILEKEGINKFDLTREDFYQRIWDFNMENKAKALKDEQTIGLSADFDRDIFTLDERVVNTVLSTFVKMYEANMVYKGVRIVNWDPKARSVIADNQTERKEKEGILYSIRYPLVRQRAWFLHNRNSDLLEKLRSNIVQIDVRANDIEKNYSNIQKNDIVIISDKNETQNPSVYKKVIDMKIFPTLEDANENIIWKNVFDEDILDINSLDIKLSELDINYNDRVRKEGLVAIYLQDLENSDYINIATTRPETIFGDTAVAVNPTDERFTNILNAYAVIPFVDRLVPIITDYKIEKEFGTGCLKVTPAHSADDYQIMQNWNSLVDKENHDNSNVPNSELLQKQKITYVNVIDKDLKLCGPVGPKYLGVKYNAAKEIVIQDLKTSNLYLGEEKLMQNILVSERTGAVVEPIVSSQWFLDIDKIRQPVVDMVANGDVRLHPKSMDRKFYHWMENLRDWAISRNLWWGYRLPVWYNGKLEESIDNDGKVKIFLNQEKIVIRKALKSDAPIMHKIDVDGWMQNFVDEDHGITAEVLKNKYGRNHGDVEKIKVFETMIDDESNAFFVAEKNGTVIGWVNIENLNSDKIHWINIYVSKDEQNQGVATRLMNHLLAEYGELETHLATPLKANLSNFYLKFGYEEYPVTPEDEKGLRMIQMKRKSQKIISLNEEKVLLDPTNMNHMRVQLEKPGENWFQDDDILDTWFSSGQWPYATLQAFDLMDTFFPTDVLCTASDILENWVSRMMMFSYFKFEKAPFQDVYLYGIVKGTDGQKMSKSKKNTIEVDDTQAQYGIDSLRMCYFYQNKAGTSYAITFDKLKNFRNFNNKIWNAAKLVLISVQVHHEATPLIKGAQGDLGAITPNPSFSRGESGIDKNILHRGNFIATENAEMVKKYLDRFQKTSAHMEKFKFGLATDKLYSSFWHEFCDIYLEQSKELLKSEDKDLITETLSVLVMILTGYLKMLHPFIPFVTDKIYSLLKENELDFEDAESLMYTRWAA